MTGRLRPGFRRAAIVAVVLLAPIALHALWDYIEVRRLIREVAAIRDRGEPVTERDLGPTAPTTDEQRRASRLYLAAAALVLDVDYARDRMLYTDLQAASLRAELPAGSREPLRRRIQAAVQPYAEAFPLLDQADALDFSRLGRGMEYSYRTASFWNLMRLNSARGALQCLSGNSDEAATIAATTIRLKRVVRASRAWLGFGTTRDDWIVPFLLSHCPPSAASLESLDRTMAEFEPGSLVQDFMAERVAFLGYVWPYYGIDARAPEHFNFRRWSPLEVVTRPWRTHRLVDEFRTRARAIAAARKPMPERKAALTAIVQRPARLNIPGSPAGGWVSASGLLESENSRWAERSAMWSAFRTAIAVERYRRDNSGRMPAALADLGPRYLTEIPTDPNSGSSLLYKPIDGGYTIYSVGANGTDDGGDITTGKPNWPRGLQGESRDAGITIRHQ